MSDRIILKYMLGFLSLLSVANLWAGTIEISLSGTDPLSVIVKGVGSNQEAISISVYVYYRDDSVTDLTTGNVSSSATVTGFGWGNGFETKSISSGSYTKGGHTFTRRLSWGNANVTGTNDDYWTTGGITALVLDFTQVGSGHAYIEAMGANAFQDFSYAPHTIQYGSRDVTLPVELAELNAKLEKGVVLLNWSTESELGSMGFNVFRADESNGLYKKVNTQIIHSAGNSTTRREYQYRDERLNEGNKNYYYKLEDVDINGSSRMHGPVEVFVDQVMLPDHFYVNQNYPNPFNPSTAIKYGLPEAATVRMEIFNLRGETIRVLQDGPQAAGTFEVIWDGRNNNGDLVPTGVYICRTVSGIFSDVKKMIFTK
jgi:hypothetical protein